MSNILFLVGLLLIPFDNLFFAPSAGWATVSPIVFSIYVVINYKYAIKVILKYKKSFCFLGGILIYSSIISIINDFNLLNLIDTWQGIVLGIMTFMALVIRYMCKNKDYENDLLLLAKSYYISLFYGIIKFISLKFNIVFILNIFKIIEKRYYHRVAFSFTEPSFTSMHLIGVLLLVVLLIKNREVKKKYVTLISLFSIVMVISGGSIRFLLDICIAVCIIMVFKFPYKRFNRKQLIRVLIIGITFIIATLSLLSLNPRVKEIMKKGVYADASLASRYFRINATTKGFIDMPGKTVLGAGLGNVHIFMNSGYDEARTEYKHQWTEEVDSLKDSKDNQLFCMYIRVIAEFGIVIFIILIIYIITLIKEAKIDIMVLFIIGYLYIQFDSYAFYSIPILIFASCYNIEEYNKKLLKENINEKE